MTWKEAQLTLQLMATERIGVPMRAAERQTKAEQDEALERMRRLNEANMA